MRDFMFWRLGVSVGAVEVIDAIQQAEAGGDAVRLAVSIESGIKGRLGDLKLFASLSGVARSESSGKLVGDFGQVDFGVHVLGGASMNLADSFAFVKHLSANTL